MSYPTDLDTLVDNTDDVMASHVNTLQAKVGVDDSDVVTSIDYFLKHASGNFRTHRHDGGSDDGSANLTALKQVAITVANTENVTGLTVTQNDTTNNPNAVIVTNAGTSDGLEINQTGVLATNQFALYVHSNVTQNASALAFILQDGGSSDQHALKIQNDGTGRCLSLDQNGNGDALYIDNDGTGYSINITQNGVLASGSRALYIYSNVAQTNIGGGFIRFHLDHASSDGPLAKFVNDGTGEGLVIDQNGAKYALYIDYDGGAGSAAIKLDGCTGSSSKNPESQSEDGWIKINVDGTDRYVPCYAAS